jgi:tetratricopeptide (TPR) repeat protein
MRFKTICVVLAAAVAFTSCNRSPEAAKRRYLESGNKYFANGKFKEARIMYKDALQKDQRFGPAWYRLGLTALKLNNPSEAVSSFRNAIELVPPESQEKWDAVVKLSDILIAAGTRQPQLLKEVDEYTKSLLKRDANSFDGHRLTADLKLASALEAKRTAHNEDAADLLQQAVGEYQIANGIKGEQEGVLLQLARVYNYQGKLPEAEKLYRQVIAGNKSVQQPYSELYGLLIRQNRMAEAEQLLKDGYAANPKEVVFLPTLAMLYSSQGRREEMIAVLQQIKGRAKDFDRAYLVTGDFYLRLGDGDAAIREFREGIANDPKKKSTYQNRIIEVLMRQGKRAEAADMNAEVLKADPTDVTAKGFAATLLLEKGDVSRALGELQAVAARDPENPVVHYNLGRAHLARSEWEQARQEFQKAIDIKPDYVVARLALAQLQMARNEFEAAQKSAEQVLEKIDPSNANALLIRSAALLGQKKFTESRASLDSMLKASPGSADVYFQLGVVNLVERKFKDAEAAFRKAHQLNPANARGLMGIVDTMLAQGNNDAALELLRSEAGKNPNRPDLRLDLANTAVRVGKYDEAIAEFNKVLSSLDKDSTKRGEMLLRIGETYRRKGDIENAVAALQQARAILPNNVNVLSVLAVTLDTSGRWSEAQKVYEDAIKLDQNNGLALNNLAFLLAEHNGDLDNALNRGIKAKQLLPNMNEVSDTLGWIYLKKNMSDSALEIFRDLVAKSPNQALFRYHFAMALNQKGDRPRAIKELQAALKSEPTKDERSKIQALLNQLGA